MPRCPVCSSPVDLAALATPPFCSERCRLVDLGRWLGESYGLPGRRSAASDEEDGEVSPVEIDPDDGDD